jgi:hypothetical protein
VSLLTACQAAVRESSIGTAPSSIIGSTDPAAVTLNALAERAVKVLSKRNWEKLLREHTITTVASTEGYSLPSDWARYVSTTAWDATNYWPMRGGISAAEWQSLKRGLVANANVRKEFRLRGGQVLIMPTPSSVCTLIIEYARSTPWTDSTGVTYRAAATADTDITVFPEHLLELDLIWRWKRAKGVDYSEEKLEAEREADLAFAQDQPSPVLDFSTCTTDATPSFVANIPATI